MCRILVTQEIIPTIGKQALRKLRGFCTAKERVK